MPEAESRQVVLVSLAHEDLRQAHLPPSAWPRFPRRPLGLGARFGPRSLADLLSERRCTRSKVASLQMIASLSCGRRQAADYPVDAQIDTGRWPSVAQFVGSDRKHARLAERPSSSSANSLRQDPPPLRRGVPVMAARAVVPKRRRARRAPRRAAAPGRRPLRRSRPAVRSRSRSARLFCCSSGPSIRKVSSTRSPSVVTLASCRLMLVARQHARDGIEQARRGRWPRPTSSQRCAFSSGAQVDARRDREALDAARHAAAAGRRQRAGSRRCVRGQLRLDHADQFAVVRPAASGVTTWKVSSA